MWKDIERISGVPFSSSASVSSAQGDNSSLLAASDAVRRLETLRISSRDGKFDVEAKRLELLRIALDKENKTNSSIQIELNNTKVALLDASSRANDLEQTNNLLQETVDALRAENDAQRNDILKLSASAASKDAQLEQLLDLETQLSDLANSNKTLTTEHSKSCDALDIAEQRNMEQEAKIDRLEMRLSDVTKQQVKDKEAAQVELKQTRTILQTKLEHASEHLKEAEAREQIAHEAKREAADELPKLMAKFKSEREAIRAEMTKVRVHIPILSCDLPHDQCILSYSCSFFS